MTGASRKEMLDAEGRVSEAEARLLAMNVDLWDDATWCAKAQRESDGSWTVIERVKRTE